MLMPGVADPEPLGYWEMGELTVFLPLRFWRKNNAKI